MRSFSRRSVLQAGIQLSAGGILSRHAFAQCSSKTLTTVQTGFETLRQDRYTPLKGHKVGIVANTASVDANLQSVVDCLHQSPAVQLQAIFGPEHGFRGSAREGYAEAQSVDARTGCTVYDIYMKTGKKLQDILKNSGITCLVFDIQDVGARFYTYIWTLFDCLEACAQLQLPLIVLDRPNPLSGQDATGPVLEPSLASFVGRAPMQFMPIRAGRPAPLEVIPLSGWQRSQFFEETGLPWCPPSPNMPTPLTALLYPGTCLFEGTRFSVGRGTALPFQYLGADQPDGSKWADHIHQHSTPGTAVRDVWFTPLAGPFSNTLLHGIHCTVTDRSCFDPITAGLTFLRSAQALSQTSIWRGDGHFFDQLCGSSKLRPLLERGADIATLAGSWEKDLTAFRALRQQFLLY
ncbi:MAG: exo-beta-N-acetylmuramidase NamZ family protein [Acetobacter cibinongensis]